jgi:hypothetical protein
MRLKERIIPGSPALGCSKGFFFSIPAGSLGRQMKCLTLSSLALLQQMQGPYLEETDLKKIIGAESFSRTGARIKIHWWLVCSERKVLLAGG